MEYLFIFDGLFKSDFGIFAIGGFFIALIVGWLMKSVKKSLISAGVAFAIAVIGEVILHFAWNMGVGFIGMIVGTVAIGCCVGFLITALFDVLGIGYDKLVSAIKRN